MGTIGTVSVASAGTNPIEVFSKTNGNDQQQFRQVTVEGETVGTYTPATSPSNIFGTVDITRCRVLLCNLSTVRVYLMFGTASLTISNAPWYVEAGERFMVPEDLCPRVLQAVAATTGSGTMNWYSGTNA
jgi:hypothetical protein